MSLPEPLAQVCVSFTELMEGNRSSRFTEWIFILVNEKKKKTQTYYLSSDSF